MGSSDERRGGYGRGRKYLYEGNEVVDVGWRSCRPERTQVGGWKRLLKQEAVVAEWRWVGWRNTEERTGEGVGLVDDVGGMEERMGEGAGLGDDVGWLVQAMCARKMYRLEGPSGLWVVFVQWIGWWWWCGPYSCGMEGPTTLQQTPSVGEL